jgi:glycosyltransferase involved in cell wall biosynthesis
LASRYLAGFYSAVRNVLMADDTESLSATPWWPPWQVIVAVDHNPAPYDLLAAEYPDHEVISNKFETGLSGARNAGIEQAAGDVVVFLDDDARAQPQWLETLLASYDDESVLSVGGVVLADWNSSVRPGWMPEECLRRLSPGARIIYDPQAVVYHHVDQTRATWRYFVGRCYAEGCSEKSYVTHTITRAVRSEPIGIFRPGRKDSTIRLAALLLGTLSAAAGYIKEMALQNVRHAGPLGDAVSEGGTP